MDPQLVKLALAGIALLGCIGLFFGIGLALAAHKFAVEANPLIEEVLESLAGAQCGGCGYPGCEGYAIAAADRKSTRLNSNHNSISYTLFFFLLRRPPKSPLFPPRPLSRPEELWGPRPGARGGGCGYPGCEGYAIAV